MRRVRIRHPKAGEAMVPEVSLRHHLRAGWAVVEDEPAEKKSKPAPKEAASKGESRVSRRTEQESE